MSRETNISDYFLILLLFSLLFLPSCWLTVLYVSLWQCLSICLPILFPSLPYHQIDELLFSHCAVWFTMFFFLPPLVPFLCLSQPLYKSTPQCLQLVGLCAVTLPFTDFRVFPSWISACFPVHCTLECVNMWTHKTRSILQKDSSGAVSVSTEWKQFVKNSVINLQASSVRLQVVYISLILW